MNVVMYVPTALGGHARYAAQLLTAMRAIERSNDVSLLTSRNLSAEFRGGGYDIHDVLPEMRSHAAFATKGHWAVSRLRHYYRRERLFERWVLAHANVDVVHCQEFSPLFAAVRFARLRRAGRRLFFTVHNITDHKTRGIAVDGCLARLWRAAWNQCDGLFVHTAGLREKLAAVLGRCHPPIHVVHHGIWNESTAVSPMSAPDRLARRSLLCFGVLRRTKGFHALLDSLDKLPQFRVVIAGTPMDAAYNQELLAKARAFDEGRVEVIGRHLAQDELGGLFATASAVVLPYTEFSAQSGVLHDAIAFGVPVVVTDVGALGETVREMGIGEVAPPSDAVALTRAIERLHTPAQYLRAVGAIARSRGERSWEGAAAATLRAYAAAGN